MNLKFIAAICMLPSLSWPSISNAQSCYESSIVSPTPFMGNDGELFKLADGSLWEVKFEYEYLYEYYPQVVICPAKGKLVIAEKSLNIEHIGSPSANNSKSRPNQATGIIESKIEGDFSGWEGETIFKLINGQIWQQSSFDYAYTYKYMPKVIIFPTSRGFELQVEGMDKRIVVVRIQ